MPLHADEEFPCCILDRLDHAIRRRCYNLKVSSRLGYRLMMEAVYFKRFRTRKPRHQAVFAQPYNVTRRLFRLPMIVMKHRGGNHCGNVLNELATAKDVQ